MKVPWQGSNVGTFSPFTILGRRDRILIRRGCLKMKLAQGEAEVRDREERVRSDDCSSP